jgi:glycosyltransferase involved in cell wall biosynthesis
MYEGLPPGTGAAGRLSPDEAERIGVLMAAEIVGLADRFVVMSGFAADRVRLDVRPEDADRIGVVPFGFPDPVADATPAAAREPIIASFGVVNEIKQNSLLVGALPAVLARHPDASLAFVGPCAEADREQLTALAGALGVGERVVITGAVTAAEYASWLDRAAVAVQLRRTANGESSAAVADCLAAGAVLVVTGIGAGRDLPADAVVPVSPSVPAGELAAFIADLLGDADRRHALAARAREYAAQHSFSIVARFFFEDVIEPATRAGLSVARLR